MMQRNHWHRGLLLVAMGAMLAGGCARRDRPPVATDAPAGRGQRVPSAPLPKGLYGSTDEPHAQQQQPAGPIKTFDDEFRQPAMPAATPATSAPAATSAGFVGKRVTVHLTQGAPALGSGPRHDVVKGVVKSVDAEWVVVEAVEGKALYVPRGSVMAIQEE